MRRFPLLVAAAAFTACTETPTDLQPPLAEDEAAAEDANPESQGQVLIRVNEEGDPVHGGIWLQFYPWFGCEVDAQESEAPVNTFDRWLPLDDSQLLTMQFGTFTEGIFRVSVDGFSGVGTGHGTASNRWDRDGNLVGRTFTLKGKVNDYMVTCRLTANRNGRQEHFVEMEPLD